MPLWTLRELLQLSLEPPLKACIRYGRTRVIRNAMVTSTFAHPYLTQVIALWLSFVPVAGMAALMIGAALRGDRGRVRIQVPLPR